MLLGLLGLLPLLGLGYLGLGYLGRLAGLGASNADLGAIVKVVAILVKAVIPPIQIIQRDMVCIADALAGIIAGDCYERSSS